MVIINPAHILKNAIDYFTRYVFIKISYRQPGIKKGLYSYQNLSIQSCSRSQRPPGILPYMTVYYG